MRDVYSDDAIDDRQKPKCAARHGLGLQTESPDVLHSMLQFPSGVTDHLQALLV